MSILSKAEDALAQANAITLKSGASSANTKALAKLKEDTRAIIAESKPTPPPVEPPTPEPEPVPTPSPLPWITPLVTDTVFGKKAVQTTLKNGQVIEGAECKGMLWVPEGVSATIGDSRLVGPHGFGADGTLASVQGGHLTLERCEITGSEGRSGLYVKWGALTLRECWFHDNGVGLGKLFQQLYIGGCHELTIEDCKIDDGEDYGLQLYSPAGYKEKISNVSVKGLEVSGCKNGGIVIAGRVTNVAMSGLLVHDNTYGVKSQELEGASAISMTDSHVWSNKTNLALDKVVTTSNVLTTAP